MVKQSEENGLRLQPHQGLKGKFDDHNQALVDWIDRDRHAHNVRRGLASDAFMWAIPPSGRS
jgi:hypothetical protein